jgi:methylmalonyl-CoA mutase cobalamin-binding subunit
MNNLFEDLRSALVYRADSKGNVLLKRMRGSSIDLPEIDEPATHRKVEFLMKQLLSHASSDIVLSNLRDSVSFVKSLYAQTHDGFRVAKGAGRGRGITVSDVYCFSVAASFCLDFLPPTKRETDASVGIGVMAPAIQDCGKNLIKLIWKVAGFDVVDFGNTVHPEAWLSEISRQDFSAVGISCMANKCLVNVRKLLDSLTHRGLSLPVVIGGIATNRLMAFDLAKEYGLPVYYGCDMNDATEVLERALAKIPVEVPEIKNVEDVSIPAGLSTATEPHDFRLFKIRISDIVIDADARRGCSYCSGDKKRLCPLEIGYEKQKSLEESIQFVSSFKFAVMVLADIPDESHRSKCKSVWEGLLGVEQYFNSAFNSAHAFKFPMTCPFCLPKECKLQKGECMFPFLYRQLHEQYNINVPRTLANVLGDAKPTGICSIILVR